PTKPASASASASSEKSELPKPKPTEAEPEPTETQPAPLPQSTPVPVPEEAGKPNPNQNSNPRADPKAMHIAPYEFTDWTKVIEEDRKKHQAVSTGFFPIGEAQELTAFDHGVAHIKIDGKWGFIVDGAQGWYNVSYDEIMPFSEDMAAVRLGDKWGYLSTEGNLDFRKAHADCKWDSAGAYSGGFAVVSLDGKDCVIDTMGNIITNESYDKIRAYGDGLFPVQRSGKWGYINLKEQLVIPYEYDDAGAFSTGIAVVVQDGKAFYIDTTGKQ
ncbi:MAG: WG repeat-containing protein, partial [Angelakisella sp.]